MKSVKSKLVASYGTALVQCRKLQASNTQNLVSHTGSTVQASYLIAFSRLQKLTLCNTFLEPKLLIVDWCLIEILIRMDKELNVNLQ